LTTSLRRIGNQLGIRLIKILWSAERGGNNEASFISIQRYYAIAWPNAFILSIDILCHPLRVIKSADLVWEQPVKKATTTPFQTDTKESFGTTAGFRARAAKLLTVIGFSNSLFTES